jgi:bis(5'-nucleosidyl)-tetraphosphatase
MTKQERSAGFILFNTTADDQRRFLLLDYGRHWDFPKGHVEKDETDFDAAVRELFEETGIRNPLRVGDFQQEIDYYFRGGKLKMIHKTVVFYIARTDQTEVVLSDEHVAFAFLDFESAMKRLTYPTARSLLTSAETYLKTR